MKLHYYYKKYPYLQYIYGDTDGSYTMFSIPPQLLAMVFFAKFNRMPKTFFDCGAATGEIIIRAQKCGMKAWGVDIKEYPHLWRSYEKLLKNGVIQIKSILDCNPIHVDLAYCNGTLTYFTQDELPRVLDKFRNVKMLCAIHNTTEDVDAARAQGDELTTCNKPRLIQPRDWWIHTLNTNGFDTTYNPYLQCFCAVSGKTKKFR